MKGADHSVSVTNEELRGFLDGQALDELEEALDAAQGAITGGSADKQTILITVTKVE